MIRSYLGQFAVSRERLGKRDAYPERYDTVSDPPGAEHAFAGVRDRAGDLPLSRRCLGVYAPIDVRGAEGQARPRVD